MPWKKELYFDGRGPPDVTAVFHKGRPVAHGGGIQFDISIPLASEVRVGTLV